MKSSLCAYNISRQSFINLGVTVADTPLARLRGLIGKMRLHSDEAVWVVPSHGIHTFGLRLAIDLIYLDARLRVVHLLEHVGPLRFGSIRWGSASVLELPSRSIYDSGTRLGDQLMICTPEEMREYWASQRRHTAEEQEGDVTQEAGTPPFLDRAG